MYECERDLHMRLIRNRQELSVPRPPGNIIYVNVCEENGPHGKKYGPL